MAEGPQEPQRVTPTPPADDGGMPEINGQLYWRLQTLQTEDMEWWTGEGMEQQEAAEMRVGHEARWAQLRSLEETRDPWYPQNMTEEQRGVWDAWVAAHTIPQVWLDILLAEYPGGGGLPERTMVRDQALCNVYYMLGEQPVSPW